ncbi:dTDP-4-dehydrorhamnose reductase [Aureimonas fodinaquatilis]|uniref:dTDP-4-dehydrorhamnose reductase n=1 Tax=Aureimonas fodinaquatilis TaxID=2565783 RepID=A0A5B0E1V4_9HYPH|nr:dTDP-4-dehydrorhamnose reductase [Aureimonas fodinaquatilis]KAA0972638.1 dTDP-4-dehydrorhamnose reductase [Aureimonas fodinaquatilis]
MRILVTGSAGQVAQAMADLAGPDVEVVVQGRPVLDITDRSSIDRAIADVRPDIVVNAAAYTAVDKAESEEAEAFAVNATGAGNVAAASAAADLPVIHISTDYVFAGDKATPYVEADATGPQGAYGRSKLAGEEAVADANPQHVILRTAWVYGPYGNNFLKTMLRLAETRDVLRVVADQRGTPTYAPDIALGILAVARQMLYAPGAQVGVFHMVAEGETNWAGFASEIFARSRETGGSYADVEPITTADYPTPAVRPANSRLETAKFRLAFGHALPRWQDGVARCLKAL